MLTKKDIKALEKKYGFFPQKRLGQNFLVDANVRDRIIGCAGFGREGTILEIGSGLGQLTFELSKIVRKVIAVEYDRKLFSILSDLSKGFSNITLIHEDFLKFNLKEFAPRSGKLNVVSNLPYSITTPVILKLFAHSGCIDFAILTLQKEFADRLVAEPSSKEYSSLTLFTEFHSEIKRLFNISKNSFYPAPKVDSTVISMRMRSEPPVKVADKKDLFELIRAGFSTRRKTLVNALLSRHYKNFSKDRLEKILSSAGIPQNARAETLAISDFARIVHSL